MLRFFIRRLIIIPIALVMIHFLAFAYAQIARPIRAARTPYVTQLESGPLLPSYKAYIQKVLSGDLGVMPGNKGAFGEALLTTTKNSLYLLISALAVSIIFGVGLGLQAVRSQPPATRGWLALFSTLGLAMPSFYIGSLFIMAMVFYVLWRGPGSSAPFPIKGFGLDRHLVLPIIALSALPVVKIAQVTAELMTGELRKQYIVVARSFGHTWRDIRWRQTMRNIMAPVLLTITGSFRMMIGELIVVEWLYSWPGLGNLMASALVPGELSRNMGATPLFLDPPVVAAVVTIIAGLFLVADLIVSTLVRLIDPRLRPHGTGGGA